MLKRSLMRRSGGLTRTPFRRRRPAADEPRVKGRPALTVSGWKALVAGLTTRCRSKCENPLCMRRNRGYLQPNHVPKASQGGQDHPDHVIMLCAACHERSDNRPEATRIRIEPLGDEGFTIIDNLTGETASYRRPRDYAGSQ